MKLTGIIVATLACFAALPLNSIDAQRSRRKGQARQMYPIPVGMQHPGFELPNVDDGKTVSLSQFRGKKTLLVHFASW